MVSILVDFQTHKKNSIEFLYSQSVGRSVNDLNQAKTKNEETDAINSIIFIYIKRIETATG